MNIDIKTVFSDEKQEVLEQLVERVQYLNNKLITETKKEPNYRC
jgi:hypothetical protein